MMICAVDQNDARSGILQRFGGGQPSKAVADNHDYRFMVAHT
jgi:hypothetical protein